MPPALAARSAIERLESHPLLEFAERRLPIAVEQLRHGGTGRRLDKRIRVERPSTERTGHGRLAGPHEADEHRGPAGLPDQSLRCQSIRSA